MAGVLARIGRAFSLRGRCSRATYWAFQAILFGFGLATFLIWAILGLASSPMITIFILVSFAPGWDASVDAYIPADRGPGFVPEENLVGRAVLAMALAGKPHFHWLDDK